MPQVTDLIRPIGRKLNVVVKEDIPLKAALAVPRPKMSARLLNFAPHCIQELYTNEVNAVGQSLQGQGSPN